MNRGSIISALEKMHEDQDCDHCAIAEDCGNLTPICVFKDAAALLAEDRAIANSARRILQGVSEDEPF